jgi:hypothetical protein
VKGKILQLGVVVHTCNPSTREAEAGRVRVQGQPGLHIETLSQNLPPEKIKRKKKPLKIIGPRRAKTKYPLEYNEYISMHEMRPSRFKNESINIICLILKGKIHIEL